MKKIQYIYGIISVTLVFAGVTLKIQHWPGASVLLTIGIASLLFLFLPAALIDNYRKEGSVRNLILYIVGYITALVVFCAALFKIMHWPGAGIAILIGLPFPFVVFLPVYLYVTSRIENFDLTKTVMFLFLMAHMSVFSALLALNVSRDMLDSSLEIVTSIQRMMPGISGFQENSSPAESVKKRGTELLTAIDACEDAVLKFTGNPKETFNASIFQLRSKDSQNAGWEAMHFGEPGSTGENLLVAMRNFKKELAENNPSPSFQLLADQLLYPDNPGDQPLDFQSLTLEASIAVQPLPWVLNYLEGLKRSTYLLMEESTID